MTITKQKASNSKREGAKLVVDITTATWYTNHSSKTQMSKKIKRETTGGH
jgi:hypothetical protein